MSDPKGGSAMRASYVSRLRGARHTRCDALVASLCCVTVLRYRTLQMLLVANNAQVSAIVRVAAPVASAVARTWGWM